MSKKVKILLSISLFINLLGVGSLAIVSFKVGGIISLVDKMFNNNNYIYEHRTQLFDELATSEKIVFIGDSITDSGEWGEMLGRADIANRGISGDTTSGILMRLAQITNGNPKKIFIMAGINDLAAKKSVEETFSNYQEIIQTIQQETPETEIYVQETLLVNNGIFGNRVDNSDVARLNERLTELTDVTVINMDNLSENGQLKNEYTLDGIHLNGKGYLKWKENIMPYLN